MHQTETEMFHLMLFGSRQLGRTGVAVAALDADVWLCKIMISRKSTMDCGTFS